MYVEHMEPMPLDEPGAGPLPGTEPRPPQPPSAPEPDPEPEPVPDPPPKTKARNLRRITVNLVPAASEGLDFLIDRTRLNQTDTVNRELQRGAHIERLLAVPGTKLLIERPDEKTRELDFL